MPWKNTPLPKRLRKVCASLVPRPYFSESRYRQELKNGRIKPSDLEYVLKDELGESANTEVLNGQTRYELRMQMLLAPVRTGPSAELSWLVAETDALRNFRREVPSAEAARMTEETKRLVMARLSQPARLGRRAYWSTFGEPAERFWRGPHRKLVESRLASLHLAFHVAFMPTRCARRRGTRSSFDQLSPVLAILAVLRAARAILICLTPRSTHAICVSISRSRFCQVGRLPDRDAGFYLSFLKLFSAPSTIGSGWLQRTRAIGSGRTCAPSLARSFHRALVARLGY